MIQMRTKTTKRQPYPSAASLSPRRQESPRVKVLLMMLGMCLAGSAWGQDLQIAGKIAFVSLVSTSDSYEVYTMNTDGTGQTRLTNFSGGTGGANPSWSPDGAKIAFYTSRDGNPEVYVTNADGTNQIRLTNNTAPDHSPSWSPDGTKIAFISGRDGNLEMYAMNADGSTPVRLTNNTAEDSGPSWSPDGAKIAFASVRDGNWEIYVMNADGTNQARLTNNSAADVAPSWSSDGAKIIFQSYRDGSENPEIYVMSADGTNQTRLTNNLAVDTYASWSPDGAKIAFHSKRDGNGDAYVMNADGTNQIRLTNNSNVSVGFSWSEAFRRIGTAAVGSPVSRTMTIENKGSATLNVSNITSSDGQFSLNPTNFSVAAGGSQNLTVTFIPSSTGTKYSTLTITSNDLDAPTARLMVNGTATAAPKPVFSFLAGSLANNKISFLTDRDGNNEVYTMNIDGTNQVDVTNSPAGDFGGSWSPDLLKMVFWSNRDGNPSIYTVNADGTGLSRLTNTTGDFNPAWSPDGSKIVFLSARDNADGELYIMGADGSGQTRLTSNSSPDNWPQWSPDGTKIAFWSDRDGNREIYLMNTDGTNQTNLTNNPATDSYFGWAPDGSKIAFSSTRDGGSAEIYLMNRDGSNPVRITTNSAEDNSPSWSPDGTKVVFRSTRDNSQGEIYTANTDGTNLVRLTNNLATDDQPFWSPFLRTLTLGTATKGSSTTATFTITNRGGGTLSVSNITSSNSQFTASPTSFNLTAGASQTVTVTFAPTSGAVQSGTLTLTHNAAPVVTTSTVSVSGTGVNPAPATPAGLAATSGNAQAALSWTANSENDLSYYVLYSSTASNFTPTPADSIAQVNKPTTTFTNTGLAAGTYYFRLAAVDSAGNKSPASAQAIVTLAPVISLSVTSVSGGSVNVGTAGTSTFTVGNTGNAALSVTGIALTGTDAAQFTVNPTTFTVNAGATPQTLILTFTPTSVGTKSASLSITHNAAGSPSILNLSGTGMDVTAPATPAGLAATPGNAQAALSWTANVESDLSRYVLYRSTTNSFTPAPADSIAQIGKPATSFTNTGLTAGTYYFKLAAVDSAGNKSPASTQASITLAPVVALSATSVALGSVNVGTSGAATLTVGNTGNAALSVTSIGIAGPDASQFTLAPSSFVVNAAVAQTISVVFTPNSAGTKSASLSITHNAAGSPTILSLSGVGVDITAPSTPASLAAVPGNGQVSLSWSTNPEPDLSHYVLYRNAASNFTPAASDSIARIAKPTSTFTNTGLAAGTYYFKLAAVDSAGNKSAASAQASVTLAPVISLSAIIVSVGSANVGASGTATFTVGNTGTAALSITSIMVAGTDAAQFTVNPTAFTINPGTAPQTLTVTFTPTSAGTKSASLSIAHNASGSPSILSLSGTGVDITAPATPVNLAAALSNGQVLLSWAANTERDLSYYVMYRSTTNNFTPAVSDSITRIDKPATTYASTNLDPGTYYFKVAAVDSAGNKSAPSAQASITLQHLLSLSTTSLNFDSVAVGLAQTLPLRLRNTGNLPLSISSIADNSDQFSSSPAVPPVLTLASGDSTLINISFTPTSQGPQTATLTISSNANPTTVTVSLSGRGSKPPVLLPVPSSLAFGDVPLRSSSTRSLTLKNPGAAARVDSLFSTDSAFEVLSPRPPFNLAARDSTQIRVRFTPPGGVMLPRTGVLRIVSSTGTVEVPLSGRGTWIGFVVSPDTLKFGKVKPGLTQEQNVTVSNPGNLRLEISSANTSNPVFTAQPRTFSVEGGSSQTVKVSFAPTQAKVALGTLTLSGNADSSKTIVLLGEGARGPEATVVPSSLPFGNVKVDSARVGILRVRNSGGDTLKVREWAGLQPPFSVTTLQTSSLSAGDSALVRVRFAPTARGVFSDTLMMLSNVETRLIPLSGRGIRAELSVPERLVFDPVPLGSTGELNLILTNSGDDTLLVTNILSGKPQRFQVESTNVVIPPNNAQGVIVRFTPTTTGKDSTDLTLSTNVGIRVVRAVGNTKVEGTVTLTPDTLRFGPVAIGAPAEGSVELRNSRGDTLRVSQVTLTPAAFKLTRAMPRFRMAPGTALQIPLTFRPTAGDTVLGLLEVRSDAPGSPHRVVLIGIPEPLPKIALSPTDTLRFGVVSPGQSQLIPLTIRNRGGGVLKVVLRSESEEFVPQQTDTIRIGTGQQQSVQVRFQPSRSGTRTANLQLWSNDPQLPLSALVMQGIGGGLRFEPVSIDFGKVLVGTDKDTSVVLINETANALTLTLDLFGIGFSANPRAAIRIDAGKRVPVQVNFQPNAEGDYSAKLEVRDRNVFIELFGKGTEVKVRPPTGLTATVGSDQVTLTWSANTEPALSYYVIYRSPQENFEPVAGDSLGRTSRTVTRFVDRSLSGGNFYYRLVAVDRAGNRSEASEPVAVTVASIQPTVTPDSLDFGQVVVGTPKTLSVVVTNPGTSTLNLTSLTLTGRDARQFAATSTAPIAISAGSSKPLTLVFNPTASGAKTALLNIAHDKGSSLTVALGGSATAPASNALQVSPTSLTMDNTPVRTTSLKILRLSNTGKSDITVSLRLGGRNPSQFKVTPSQATVRAGRAQSISITFAPTSTGTKSATLTLTPSTGNPLTVALSGTATAAITRGLNSEQEAAKPLGVAGLPFGLGENYPNPFNAQTLIPYQLAQAGPVRLAIYDMLGRQVAVLVNGEQEPGSYQVVWDGRDQRGEAVATGIYFYRIEAGPFRSVRKLLLVR